LLAQQTVVSNGVYRRPLGELIGIRPISEQFPAHYALEQNYPNPFNVSSKFIVHSSKAGNVKITVYNLLGREMETLVNEILKPGTYEVEFDGTNYPSGVYFYRLEIDSYSETRKLMLLK